MTRRMFCAGGTVALLAAGIASAAVVVRPVDMGLAGQFVFDWDSGNWRAVAAALPIDVDLDGTPDLRLWNEPVVATGVPAGYENRVHPLNGAALIAETQGLHWRALPLVAGDVVGHASTFAPADAVAHTYSDSAFTQVGLLAWSEPPAKHLGFCFLISGQLHYGWMRMEVDYASPVGMATVWEVAYETTPQTPLTVPEPAAGLLLAGALARRRR